MCAKKLLICKIMLPRNVDARDKIRCNSRIVYSKYAANMRKCVRYACYVCFMLTFFQLSEEL